MILLSSDHMVYLREFPIFKLNHQAMHLNALKEFKHIRVKYYKYDTIYIYIYTTPQLENSITWRLKDIPNSCRLFIFISMV